MSLRGDEMERYRKLAIEIIDEIEERIFAANPRLAKMRFRGNSLLYGEDYYDVEDWLCELLKTSIKRKPAI